MIIVLVEDDQQKLEYVKAEILKSLPNAKIVTAASYKSGVIAAKREPLDLLIVDMTLPTVDRKKRDRGYKELPFGGEELLTELNDDGLFPRCILISSFESFVHGQSRRTFVSIAEGVEKVMGNKLLGAIHYEGPSAQAWRQRLGDVLQLNFKP